MKGLNRALITKFNSGMCIVETRVFLIPRCLISVKRNPVEAECSDPGQALAQHAVALGFVLCTSGERPPAKSQTYSNLIFLIENLLL